MQNNNKIVSKILTLCLYIVIACLGVTFAWMTGGTPPEVNNVGLFYGVNYRDKNGVQQNNDLTVVATSITFDCYIETENGYVEVDDLDDDYLISNLLPGEAVNIRFDFRNTSPSTSTCKFIIGDMFASNDIIFSYLYFGITNNTYRQVDPVFDGNKLPSQIYVRLDDASISNVKNDGKRNVVLYNKLYVPPTTDEQVVSVYGYLLFSRLATMEDCKNITLSLGQFRAIIS